jgi:hypothetical protein
MIENLYPDRRWLVIPTSITSSINFAEVEETSIETLRLSVDGTETFVKYPVNIVTASYTQSYIDSFSGATGSYIVEPGIYGRPSIYTSSYHEYTYPEILEVLSTPEWTKPLPSGSEAPIAPVTASVPTASYVAPNPNAPLPTID